MEDDIWTIPEMLHLRSEINSDLKCFTFYDRHGLVASTLTPRDIYPLSGKFAYLLRTWGFQAGDVIANGLPNSPERVITDFGVIMAGCILTNCQVIEKDGQDFWHTANICQVRGVIIPSSCKSAPHQLFSPYLPPASIRPQSSTATNAGSAIYLVTIPEAPSIQNIVVCHRGHPENGSNSLLDNLRAMSDEKFIVYDCLPSDLAVLVPTSGSSGLNKLVPFTHEKVLNHGRSYRSSPSLVYFNDRPMGWMGGFPYDFLASGVRRVLQDAFNNQQTKSPSILWGILTSSQCMGAALTPCDLYPLIDHFLQQPPGNRLLFIAVGGQPIKKDLTKALGVLCRCMRVSYGSTEAGVVALDSVSDHSMFEDFYCGVVKVDMRVKIVDSQGNKAKEGVTGEIYLKSDRVMQQYYNVIDKSQAPNSPALFSKDGWYKTGDLGMLREDRKLYCYGRIADVVFLGSTLVYMSLPESILSKCPFIQSSSIVCVETSNSTVLFGAFVVPRAGWNLTPNMVIDFFESQIIDTEYKNKIKLSYIHICDGLPLLPTGKINKRQMKRILRDKFLTRCDS